MNYNKLYYFYIITESKNLFDASRKLFISQPALSRTIRDLESEFRVSLFEHTGRSMRLTYAGEVLRKECINIFQNESTLLNNMRLASSEKTVTLKFGYMLYKELFRLIPAVEEFNRNNSLIQIESIPYTERIDLNSDLLSGKIDLALRMFTTDETIPELNYQILEETRLSVIAEQNHPVAKNKSLHLSDLKNEKFIFLGTGSHSSEYRYALEWCRRCGFEPDIICSFDWIGAVMLMVQTGCGITILSNFAPLKQMVGLVSIPLENAPLVYAGLFWRKEDNRSALEHFRKYYIQYKLT